MKAVAYYDLPMNGEGDDLRAIIEKAREQGLPLLAVVFETDNEGVAPEIDGLTADQQDAMALGFAISEMEHELAALSTQRMRKVTARVLAEDDDLYKEW